MLKEIYITGAGGICGAFDSSPHPNDILEASDGCNFMSLRKAQKWLPINLQQRLNWASHSDELPHIVDLDSVLGDKIVCPVQFTDTELAERADLKVTRRERHQFFAMIAAAEAMQGVSIQDSTDYACIGATGGAGLLSNYQAGLKLAGNSKLSAFDNLKYLPNIFVGDIAQRYQLRGPSEVHGTACAASGDAFNSLIRMILLGEVSGGLLVGTDAAISEFGLGTFARQKALGNGLTFQKDRTGFVMGEGAGALFIESKESMERAGRTPLAKILGYASGSDANPNIAITAPDPAGQAIAIQKACAMAGISVEQLTCLIVHGTATKGDSLELEGVRIAANSAVINDLLVSAPKTWFGHLLGAASVVEMVMLIAQFKHGLLLPTRGLTTENIDPDCANVTHLTSVREMPKNAIVKHSSFGFAQTNAVRILQAV